MAEGLSPAFTQGIHDYTTTCAGGRVTVRTRTGRGVRVKVHTLAEEGSSRSYRLALAPGQRLVVRIRAGKLASGYSVRCLPKDFPTFRSSGKLSPAVPFFSLSEANPIAGRSWHYAVIADRNGVPVWWLRTVDPVPINIRPAGKGRLAMWTFANQSGWPGTTPYEFRDYRGALRGGIGVVGEVTDLHEASPSSSGNWYVEAYVKRSPLNLTAFGGPQDGSVIDARIEEVREDRTVVWSWDTSTRVALAETGRWWGLLAAGGSPTSWDLVHLNSIEDDGHGGLIVSMRTVDAVYRIRKSDGSIDWKLGGTATPRSLRVMADGGGRGNPLLGQHDARLLPDGTISLFDNRSNSGEPPRVTRWRVSTSARTATLVESFGDPQVTDSFCCGSARRFADGSWLVSWGGSPLIRGYDADHRLNFSLKFDGRGFSYRAVPFTHTDVTRSELVAGMDSMHPR